MDVFEEAPATASFSEMHMVFTLALVLVAVGEVFAAFDGRAHSYVDLATIAATHLGPANDYYVDPPILGHALVMYWSLLSKQVTPTNVRLPCGFGWKKEVHRGVTPLVASNDFYGMSVAANAKPNAYTVSQTKLPYTWVSDMQQITATRHAFVLAVTTRLLDFKGMVLAAGVDSLSSLFSPARSHALARYHFSATQAATSAQEACVGNKRSAAEEPLDEVLPNSSSSSSSGAAATGGAASKVVLREVQQSVLNPLHVVREQCIHELNKLAGAKDEKFSSYKAFVEDDRNTGNLGAMVKAAIQHDLPMCPTLISILFWAVLGDKVTAEIMRRMQPDLDINATWLSAIVAKKRSDTRSVKHVLKTEADAMVTDEAEAVDSGAMTNAAMKQQQSDVLGRNDPYELDAETARLVRRFLPGGSQFKLVQHVANEFILPLARQHNAVHETPQEKAIIDSHRPLDMQEVTLAETFCEGERHLAMCVRKEAAAKSAHLAAKDAVPVPVVFIDEVSTTCALVIVPSNVATLTHMLLPRCHHIHIPAV